MKKSVFCLVLVLVAFLATACDTRKPPKVLPVSPQPAPVQATSPEPTKKDSKYPSCWAPEIRGIEDESYVNDSDVPVTIVITEYKMDAKGQKLDGAGAIICTGSLKPGPAGGQWGPAIWAHFDPRTHTMWVPTGTYLFSLTNSNHTEGVIQPEDGLLYQVPNDGWHFHYKKEPLTLQ